jgi:AAA domain, putative AbiEii toxin, Type IV TA system
MTVIIPNLAIAGYRSFGEVPQYFDSFAKINLFIGRNNAGKSNVIRFLSEVYRQASGNSFTFDALDLHLPNKPPLLIGAGERIEKDSNSNVVGIRSDYPNLRIIKNDELRKSAEKAFAKLFESKRTVDRTELCWSLLKLPDRTENQESWLEAMVVLSDHELKTLWNSLTSRSGGSRLGHWAPEVIKLLQVQIPAIKIAMVPAIRQIGAKGSTSEDFNGQGIIERLARLQNPDVHNQQSRHRFEEITKFVQTVIDSPSATIEIPFDRDTINVHIDGKVLPIESLGSGIHEVIILAAAATVLSNHVVCIEEPELHLNPILQRKLIRYLSDFTNNQYFMSTHSAALMDNQEIEIYHIKLENHFSVVERVTSDSRKSLVCEDLGYHPSDLLQANCVIWVEGPSDRIYLNYWIRALTSEFVEGIHYSIMFYGGRLASHLTNEENSADLNDFISLRRLNRRGIIVIDSDRKNQSAHLNSTKRRLRDEFDIGPGHAWVTDGREIENYVPEEQLKAAIADISPKALPNSAFGKYDNRLKAKNKAGSEVQIPKVEVARFVTSKFEPNLSTHDLKRRLGKVSDFIRQSNPGMRQA